MAFIEQPSYEVLEKDGDIEVRRYEGFNVAEIRKKAMSDMDGGFNDLFRYISGENSEGLKISMTAPVFTEVGEEALSTAFVMPARFDLDALPLPSDNRIEIRRMGGGLYGVIRFSGFWSEEKFLKMSSRLRLWIEANGYVLNSEALIARYNPPFTPPFLRRNEVLFRIEKEERE